MIKVLFVCTGNICRSPTAEAIFRKKVAEAKLDDVIFSDSAATSGHHVGETPDVRAQLACRKRGLDIKEHRAREIAPEDFAKFDLILVMDGGAIAASGTHEELLKTSEIYREVYESQTNGGDENA